MINFEKSQCVNHKIPIYVYNMELVNTYYVTIIVLTLNDVIISIANTVIILFRLNNEYCSISCVYIVSR